MKGAFASLLLVVGPAVGAQEQVLSLPEALRRASQGPSVQAAWAFRDAAAARVEEAQSARWLQVELDLQARALTKDPGFLVPKGAFGNPFPLSLVTGEREVQNGRLTGTYLLWDWGRVAAFVKASEKGEEAAEAQAGVARRAALLATLRAFCQAQSAQGELDAARQAVATAKETLRIVSAAVRQQILADSDRLATEFYLAQREAQVAAAKAQLAAALAVLTELTGFAAEAVTPVAVEDLPTLPAGAAPEAREEVRALAAQKEAALHLARAFRREQWPSVALVAGVENVRDHFFLHQTNSFALLTVRSTLFDGGKARAAAQEQEMLAQARGFAEQAVKQGIAREVAVAKAKVEAFREQVLAAERSVAAAEEELRLETSRHGQGLTTTRDLLAAQEHVVQAKAAQAAAQAQLLAALGELVGASGGDLLAYFGGQL